jgi:predicted RNA-binding protein YlqC (UPF0109 family)
MLKELLLFIVSGLVDNPEKVLIAERRRGDLTILEMAVADEDQGRVIGKNGRNINAVRQVLSAAAQSKGGRLTLNVMG